MHCVERSLELYRRAQKLIPGGTQLISRRPMRYAYGVSPIYAARAKGARFWDVDGNEYIDWASGIGAIILGYCDDVVDSAVCEQIRSGTTYSINHELELELAEELGRTIPSSEMVRYAKSGGEACAMAIRIARGVTGRDKVLCCGYHGWHDWYLAANLNQDDQLASHLLPGIEPIGVPRALAGTTAVFPYGDANWLAEALDKNPRDVAAIIMEPARSEPPPEGYLAAVRQLCDERNVVLIFDEVSSGFRVRLGGVQELTGVTPDMTVLGKAISNGYPMAAVVGQRTVMEPAARMFISSTYWSDTIGLRAALTTIRELRERRVPEHLDRVGSELKRRLNEVAHQTGAPIECQGLNVHPTLRFQVADDAIKQKLTTLYIQEMAKRGCHGYASFYLNFAQGSQEIEQTVAAAQEVFGIIEQALTRGNLDSLLECDTTQEAFRRLVR
jgi:glutamate-1-semialdehyde 2,1-aminomutase